LPFRAECYGMKECCLSLWQIRFRIQIRVCAEFVSGSDSGSGCESVCESNSESGSRSNSGSGSSSGSSSGYKSGFDYETGSAMNPDPIPQLDSVMNLNSDSCGIQISNLIRIRNRITMSIWIINQTQIYCITRSVLLLNTGL
jgi:hypothetical protein